MTTETFFNTETAVERLSPIGQQANGLVGADSASGGVASTFDPGAADPIRYRARVSPAWNIGANPNGGYVLAMVVRAMADAGSHAIPLSVTSHFLRPATAGSEAEIEVSVIRGGRRFSTVEARLVQDGRERLRVVGTFGAEAPPRSAAQSGSAARSGSAPHDVPAMPAPELCPSRAELAQGIELPLLDRVDVRIAPSVAEPGRSARAESGGWIRFVDESRPEALALFQFCDSFPPTPFSLHGEIGWVPTLELTVHPQRAPVGEWVGAWFRARGVDAHPSADPADGNGVFVEDGVLWDEQGVVAYCRQLALLNISG